MNTILATAILISTALIPIPAKGQTARNTTINVSYTERYYTVTTQTDRMALDIDEHTSHFYSENMKREKEIIDSLNNAGNVSIESLNTATSSCTNGQSWHIYKGMPKNGELTFIDEFTPDEVYRYVEDMPQIKWNLLEGDTVIIGYRCQKAVAKLRGRQWTVWYSPDIPIQDGPWKLCGLPGLILKAEESEGLYTFECIGVERTDDIWILPKSTAYTDCTATEYYKFMRRRLEDPIGFLTQRSGTDFKKIAVKTYGANALQKTKAEFIEYYDKE